LLGIGEAAGLPLGELRRANQFENQESMGRFFRDNPDEPQSFRDIDGVGSFGRYVRGLAIDSAPELTTSLATGGAGALMGLGTAGRVGLAAAANYPAAVGDILQNQRDEGGRTRLGVATALGVPYAAADLVGLDAALAGGRMARTGIKRLDDMQGFRGGLARTGANVALNAPIEGASETFQEGINQLGRIAVNPNQTLFNEDANERYLESFIGGAALGGSASAAMGGWRRSAGAQPRTVDEGQFDLTGQANPPTAPQFNLTTEMDPLQGRINQNLGLQRTPLRDYEKQFLEAFNEPSGQFTQDPETGIERELTAGELQQMQLGDLKAQEEATTQREQQIAQETLLSTAQALGVTPVANVNDTYDVLGGRVYGQPQVAKLVQEVAALNQQFSPDQQQLNAAILGANLVNFSGKTGIPTAQKINNAVNGKLKQLQLEGVESVERAAEILNDQVATLVAAGKNEGDVKLGQIATVYEKLTGQAPPALGGTTAAAPATTTPVAQTQQPRFQRAPAPQGQTNVSQAATPAGTAAPSVDGRSPVVPGSVVNPGRNAAVDQGVGGDAGNPGATTQQAPLLPNANVQQPAAVEIDPTQYAEDEDALEILKMTVRGDAPFSAGDRASVVDAIEEEAAGERRDREDLQDEEIDAILNRRFADSKDPARDRRIFEAFLTATKYAPYGSVAKVKKAVGSDFGVEEKMVDKIGNPKELVRVGAELGFSQEQIEQAFGITPKRGGKPKAEADEDTQTDEDAARAARDEAENAEEPVMGSFVDPDEDSGLSADGGGRASEKDMASGLTEAGFDGEGGFGLDDSRFWQKASSSGNKAAAPLLSLGATMDGLRQSIVELESQGMTNAVALLREAVAAQQKKLDALLDSLSKKRKPKKAAAEEQEAEAETASEEETKGPSKEELAELADKQEQARLTADRKGFSVGDTVNNPKLGTGTVIGFTGGGAETAARVQFAVGEPKNLLLSVAKLEKVAGAPAAETKVEATAATAPKKDSGQTLWDGLRKTSPDLVAYEDLTDNERGYLTELADRTGGKPKLKDEMGLQELMGRTTDMKFGKDIKDAKAKNPYTAKELLAELKDFIRADIPGRKLLVVDSIEDLLRSPDKMVRAVGAAIALEGAYGVAANGRGYLIANRIQKGAGRAKFMHEVGAHLGLEKLLPKAEYDKLTQQIVNWAKKDDGSTESELALNAVERVQNAGTPQKDRRSELLAYFIEEAMEAGIDPTADGKMSGPLREWFRTLWAAFKTAVRKLGFKPESMTAQDVVNLAFGAARLEINGTWHGTAAAFRNFRNKFIGSGEGATAYGWGTYLAERAGIAKGYWSADVSRKTTARTLRNDAATLAKADAWLRKEVGTDQTPSSMNEAESWASWTGQSLPDWAYTAGRPEGNLMRVDTAVQDERVFDYDKPVIKQSNYVVNKLLELLDPVTDEVVAYRNKDVEELTGRDLIGTGENDLGLLSNLIMDDAISLPAGQDKQFDEAVRQGKYHEAASHLLRGIGLDGIKFYDAKSRGTATDAISFGGRNYNRDDLRDQGRKWRDSDPDKAMAFGILRDVLRNGLDETKQALEAKVAKQAEMFAQIYADSAARYNVKADAAADRARAQKEADESYEGQRLAWLNANEADISFVQNPKTRNLIVFDDKNVFRVGGEAAADRQRMKFGSDMVELGKRGQLKEKAGKTRVDTANDRAIKLLDKAAKAKDPAEAEALRAEAYALFGATAGKLSGMKFGKNTPGTGQVFARALDPVPNQFRGPVKDVLTAVKDASAKGLDYVVFTSDLVDRAIAAGVKSAQTFRDLLVARTTEVRKNEREVERISDMYALVPDKDRQGDRSVNNFLFESTRQGKWGYDSGKFKADPAMAIWFKSLDEKSQDFVKAVYQHGNTVLAKKKQTVLKYTETEYDARIANETDPKVKADLEKDKANSLKRFQRLFALREGLPYAPIKRTGSHVVVAMSAAYKAAKTAGDTKLMEKLESDEANYQVTFTNSKWEARRLSERLATDPAYANGDVYLRERDKHQDMLYGGDGVLKSLAKLRTRVENSDDKSSAKMLRMVSDLYLEALAENSARKSEMRRRGIAGDVDMIASFAQQGRADSNFMASVQFGQRIQDSIQAMTNEVKDARDEGRASELRNELLARYEQTMDVQETPWINRLTRLSSIYWLATSPAYYMQNLTQPWMMSVPAMAGRHNWVAVNGAIFKAYGELKGVVSSGKAFKQNFDLTKVPGDVRDAIQELANRGKIDIGLESEMGEFSAQGQGKVADNINKIDKGLRLAVQKVETINRLSTAMAAYRLELGRTKDPKKALDYADRILTDTHGDYTGTNAPRPFNNPVGKVALQFRKFQLIQLTYYAKLLSTIYADPNERMAAFKMLGYSLGHTALFAGVRGLPGFAAFAFVAAKLLGDDDEPYDLEARMRNAIGDTEMANLIMRGAPTLAGLDISGKVGAGNMLSILPFSNADLTTQQGRSQAAGELFLGAAGGMVSRMADGLGQVLSGDVYRGLESLLPKGLGDVLKAGRETTEGMTRRNGDLMLSPEEISYWEALWQGLGVQSVQKSVVYEQQQRVRNMDENFRERTTRVKNDYAKAVREKDTDAMAEARQAWTKLQEARVRNGYTKQPMSNLLKAPQEQSKREKNTAGGVAFNKQNRGFVESQI
jgi:hypothetical protein